MSVEDKDPLLAGLKWRCKICMQTFNMSDNGAGDLSAMEFHVKKHRANVAGWKDPATQNMNWRPYIKPVDQESTISQTRYT